MILYHFFTLMGWFERFCFVYTPRGERLQQSGQILRLHPDFIAEAVLGEAHLALAFSSFALMRCCAKSTKVLKTLLYPVLTSSAIIVILSFPLRHSVYTLNLKRFHHHAEFPLPLGKFGIGREVL